MVKEYREFSKTNTNAHPSFHKGSSSSHFEHKTSFASLEKSSVQVSHKSILRHGSEKASAAEASNRTLPKLESTLMEIQGTRFGSKEGIAITTYVYDTRRKKDCSFTYSVNPKETKNTTTTQEADNVNHRLAEGNTLDEAVASDLQQTMVLIEPSTPGVAPIANAPTVDYFSYDSGAFAGEVRTPSPQHVRSNASFNGDPRRAQPPPGDRQHDEVGQRDSASPSEPSSPEQPSNDYFTYNAQTYGASSDGSLASVASASQREADLATNAVQSNNATNATAGPSENAAITPSSTAPTSADSNELSLSVSGKQMGPLSNGSTRMSAMELPRTATLNDEQLAVVKLDQMEVRSLHRHIFMKDRELNTYELWSKPDSQPDDRPESSSMLMKVLPPRVQWGDDQRIFPYVSTSLRVISSSPVDLGKTNN